MEASNCLLTTNEPLNEFEKACLQAELDDILARISQLEEQVRQGRGALSAVGRIPSEILGEIFIQALPPAPMVLESKDRGKVISLNLVCRRWRETALRCHQLWSRVRAEGNDVSFKPIQFWMARSGSLPKRLELVPPSQEKHRDEDQEDEEEEDEEEDRDEEEEEVDEDEDQDEDAEEDNESEDDEGEGEQEEERTNKDRKSPDDALVQILTDGVPLHHLGVQFSDLEDLEQLLESLGGLDRAPSKPRPWDGIQSLGLGFTDGSEWLVDSDASDVLGMLLLRLPTGITSFKLHLPDGYTLPIDTDEGASYEDPFLQLPEKFAEKLTMVSLTCNWGIQHMFKLLEFCTNIETLTLDFDSMAEDGIWTAGYLERLQALNPFTIKLPGLRSMRLRKTTYDALDFLHFLESPGLVNLDLNFCDDAHGGNNDEGDLEDALFTFLAIRSQSAPTLNSLRLSVDGLRFHPKGLCMVLDELPALTHLTIEDAWSDIEGEELLRALVKRCRVTWVRGVIQQPKPFLQSLQSLELIGLVTLENIDLVSNFISLRQESLPPGKRLDKLNRLTVAYGEPSPLDINRRKQRLNKHATVVDLFPLKG